MEIAYIFSKEPLLQNFSSLLVLVFFSRLSQMKEGKGEGGRRGGSNGGQALVMWESGWCATLVVVMILLRHISCPDNMLPSGLVGRALTSTRFGRMVSGVFGQVLILRLGVLLS